MTGEDDVAIAYYNNTICLGAYFDEKIGYISLREKSNYALRGIYVSMSESAAKQAMQGCSTSVIYGDTDYSNGVVVEYGQWS